MLELAHKVPCPLCKVPAETPCVNSVDGSGPRDQPHYNRAVRARIVTSAIAENLALGEAE
jgi:hypothetical protein